MFLLMVLFVDDGNFGGSDTCLFLSIGSYLPNGFLLVVWLPLKLKGNIGPI